MFKWGEQVRIRHKIAWLFIALLLTVAVMVMVFPGCTTSSVTIPKGWSGCTITDNNTLVISSMGGKLVALDAIDGSRIWSVPVLTEVKVALGCAAQTQAVIFYGSPIVSGNMAYVGGYNGVVYAFAIGSKDEDPKWVYPREDSKSKRVGSIIGGLAIGQGKVFFGSSNKKVYALDAVDGSLVWAEPFLTGDKIWSTPAIDSDNDTVFIGSFDKKLYALNASDGTKKWEFETGGAIVSTPVLYDDTVYIGSFDRNLYALNSDNGSLKWNFMAGNWFWTKPVVYDGKIYASCLDGKVYVLEAGTGKQVAEFNLGKQVKVSSSPIVVAGSVIVATDAGVLYTLDAGSNEKRVLIELGEKVSAPLSALGTTVFIHTSKDSLFAVDTRSEPVAKREFNIE
jgi:outer membrane protein assembly factor BamB